MHFYETLAHELTVSVRVVWSNEEITDSEIIEQLKVLNEIQHRVTSKIHVERTECHDWPESEFIAKVLFYFKRCPGIASVVGHAINDAYEIVVEKGS